MNKLSNQSASILMNLYSPEDRKQVWELAKRISRHTGTKLILDRWDKENYSKYIPNYTVWHIVDNENTVPASTLKF